MREIPRIQGSYSGNGRRFALVAARFNSRVVEKLVDGAIDCLVRHGVPLGDVTVVEVPGAWEIPFAVGELARSGHYAGIVALGAVIRGETPHFDYVCQGCAGGLMRASEQFRLPIGFGVLTCDSSQQAEERAGGKAGNKGWDAALATLEMADLAPHLAAGPTEGADGG